MFAPSIRAEPEPRQKSPAVRSAEESRCAISRRVPLCDQQNSAICIGTK